MECILRDLVTENADLQSRNQTKDRELAEAQQQLHYKEEQLQSSEREKVTVQQQLTRSRADEGRGDYQER